MAEAGLAADKVDGGVRSIARAVDVLRLFDLDHPRRTLREIVALTGLPKTTAVRVLATLDGLGLIVDLGDSSCSLGAGFLRWVDLAGSLWEVGADARRVMTRLVDMCGETVNVYIRRDLSRVSIAQVEGTATVRSVVKTGVPYPLESGAAAKVLLGGASESVLRHLVGRPDRDLDSLRREVLGIRQAGYAVTHGERELGASAVAAPILSADGRVLAALSIGGPTSRFTADRVGRYVDAVTESAAEISSIGLGSVEAFL
ncbi:DNA-binding IclR family transcriptional regulator [Rhodococcus sp. PvR044]|uniref:IclR family transcriptional regulator n=1 Tax=unclassified Rhodococcus (in: high G+C Gram-positive bacteria) TaxID=192944 RepID=UPI000BCAAC45|nr:MULTISPECIES: IclR family transcriptional regulator [unclassified Rhodococcus (in: high G+C Gram-positive bacteria)]MBP1161913.1 DNA-binding IclR family transcriptional regulator [Rhodococcus sp. PvR099]PTR43377.1 IclR family transcriptional regulator [Rhodococcus sp. OK611]SNX91240.1 transcriptional regulator, IclR family [Rhodococcus sp. OK270]